MNIFFTVTLLIKFASVQTDNFHILKHSLLTAPPWYSLFLSYAQAKNPSSSFSAPALTDNFGLKCDNQAQQNYIITATALTRHCEHTPLPCTSRVLPVLQRMRSNAICFVRGLQSDSHIEENRKSCFPQWTCSFLMLQHFEEAAFQREKNILSLITSSMASVQIL